jgi:cupin 2 domain-containing protein
VVGAPARSTPAMSTWDRGHLAADGSIPGTGEQFDEVLRTGNVVIEHIVSSATPEPVEYRQRQDEWVILLAGSATLEVAGERVELTVGDWVFLGSGVPHRVVRTAAGTRWLAVHVHR